MTKETQRIKKLKDLVDADGGQAEFARKRSQPGADKPIDPTYISQILTGHRGFGEKAAANMARRAGLPDDYFDHSGNTERGPEMRGKVPVIDLVEAGKFCGTTDQFLPGSAEEWVETTVPINEHTYALRIKGHSMTNPNGDPSFPPGSVVVVEPSAVGPLQDMVNQFVIVKRPGDDEATFKQLVKDGGRFLLKPLNPQYPMLELRKNDVVCGLVREKVMRFF